MEFPFSAPICRWVPKCVSGLPVSGRFLRDRLRKLPAVSGTESAGNGLPTNGASSCLALTAAKAPRAGVETKPSICTCRTTLSMVCSPTMGRGRGPRSKPGLPTAPARGRPPPPATRASCLPQTAYERWPRADTVPETAHGLPKLGLIAISQLPQRLAAENQSQPDRHHGLPKNSSQKTLHCRSNLNRCTKPHRKTILQKPNVTNE